MYTKVIPFKDFKGKARNQEVNFNLEVREIVKLLAEFQIVFTWQESLKGDVRDLTTEEVVEFYNSFEKILLEAWGEPSEDGQYFRKNGRFDFEESKLFAACMEEFVSNPQETGKLLESIMPENMAELVKKAEGNIETLSANPETSDQIKAQIAALQSKLPAEAVSQ